MEANAAPRWDLRIGKVSFLEEGWLPLVTHVELNLNNDKTASRGRRKLKANHAKIVIENPNGQFDNVSRFGTGIELTCAYRNDPLKRAAKLVLQKVTRDDGAAGATVTLDAVGHAFRLVLEKTARKWQRRTRSQIAKDVAAEFGFSASVTDDDEIVTEVMMAGDDLDEFLEGLANDLGFHYWVDDAEDPPCLCFRSPDHLQATQLAGEKLSISARPKSGAALIASHLRTTQNVVRTTVATAMRKTNGRLLVTDSSGRPKGAELIEQGGQEVFTAKGGHVTEGAAAKRTRNLADSVTPKTTMEATFPFLVPYFRLNQLVPIVGHGDRDGTYRLVDITLNPIDGQTIIKGVIGGRASTKERQATTQGDLAMYYQGKRAAERVKP